MAFKRDLSGERERLARQHFLHLEDVLSDRFVETLRQCGRAISEHALPEVEEWHIPGKKRQYLFDFPTADFFDDFCRSIAGITGYDPAKVTIGERHIKVYLDEAPDYCPPHLDRQAAAFTIGFPIHIPDESRVCFFPHLSEGHNDDVRARFAEVPEGTDMEAYYADPRIASFKGDVGDMFIFHGSSVFHERTRPAGCKILYIKINDTGEDPLGEHAALLEKLGRAPQPLEVA